MIRVLTFVLLAALIITACGESTKEDKTSSETKKSNEIVDVDSSEVIEEPEIANTPLETMEKPLLEEDSVFVDDLLSQLKENVEAYCNCMSNASSSDECKSEYAKLSFGIDEKLNDRLPHEFKKNMMRKASDLIIESHACDKE